MAKTTRKHRSPKSQLAVSETKHVFETGAVRSVKEKNRFDLIPSHPLRRLAARYAMGAEKYGEINWQKGMPFSDLLNHIQEHLERAKEKYFAMVKHGNKDPEQILRALKREFETTDDDLAGAAWGCFALMHLIHVGKLSADKHWTSR